jgi:hypothetical protein
MPGRKWQHDAVVLSAGFSVLTLPAALLPLGVPTG